MRYGRFLTVVHPVPAVLAAGFARADRISICVAAEHSVSHCRHRADGSFRIVERHLASSRPPAARSESHLIRTSVACVDRAVNAAVRGKKTRKPHSFWLYSTVPVPRKPVEILVEIKSSVLISRQLRDPGWTDKRA